MKTFTEITEKKLSKLFTEFNNYPQLAAYITAGYPVAIAGYLKSKMIEEKSDYAEVIIGGDKFGELAKFILKASKKGDSIALIPEFELMSAGKDFVNTDEIEFDETAMTNMANDLSENKELISAFNNAFAGKVFKDDSWEDSTNGVEVSDERGVTFDDELDIAMAATSVISAIFEVLTNNKDASSDLEYDVAGLGKFKVTSAKDTYSVTLTFDKEFKGNCKSDKLADILASVE